MSEADIVDGLYYAPYVPRPKPTPIPSADWNAEPTYCLAVNGEWVSHILGVLVALDQPDTWIGNEAEIEAARYQVSEIMTALMEACVPAPDPYFIGEVRLFAHSDLPDGWVACQGQSLLRADYPDLFAAIGTTYGAADGTHFSLPETRGKFPVGYNASFGSGYNLGDTGGEATHTLTVDEMPAHHHDIGRAASGTAHLMYTGIQVANYTSFAQTENAGGGNAHENRPPFIPVVMAIYTGVV